MRTQTHTWSFPYCAACKNHAETYVSGGKWGSGIAGTGFVLGAVLGLSAGCGASIAIWILSGLAALVVGIVLRLRAKQMSSPECATSGPAVRYIGWDGNHQIFDMGSSNFATRFMQSNMDKLVNVRAEGRQLIAAAHATQQQAIAVRLEEARADLARAAAVSAEARDRENLVKILSKLEKLKGPSSRRAALEAGLLSLQSEAARSTLALEASKIEVAAALEKAEGMTSAAGKLRVLESALAELRADSVPDEYQANQVAWLEDAIARAKGG